jgi:hypothetical protein
LLRAQPKASRGKCTIVPEHAFYHRKSKQFDFNLQFEQLYFSILPSALFIVAASWRTLLQARKPKVVHSASFQYIKLVCAALPLSYLRF